MKNKKIYKVGLYLRLSRDDGDNVESQSITNQRIVLDSYLKNSKDQLIVVNEYVDDGYSGSNFERPAWKQLMMDVNNKKSNVENHNDVNKKIKENEIVKKSVSSENIIKSDIDYSKFLNLMLIRSKNTMINALKSELTKEQTNLDVFNDYTFDQENGYLACELLDGTVRASCVDSVILSYDYESMIEKMANHLDKLNEFYNRILNNNKKIALITNDEWNNLKSEYMLLRKSGKQFTYQEEPNLNINNNNDKISSEEDEDANLIKEAKELFGDIVEIEED